MAPKPRYMPVQGGTYRNDWGDPRGGGTRQHKGTDIFAPRGTPVYAVQAGLIATRHGGAGGEALWVSGRWYYAHLDSFAKGIKDGTYVKAGQVIGYVGNSGNAQGGSTHLHFGWSPDGSFGGTWANPYPTLKALETGQPPPKATADEAEPTATAAQTGVPAAPAAPDDTTGVLTAAPELGDTSTPLSPTRLGPPGSADPTATPDFNPVETWQLISAQPLASPESVRYAELAALQQGG